MKKNVLLLFACVLMMSSCGESKESSPILSNQESTDEKTAEVISSTNDDMSSTPSDIVSTPVDSSIEESSTVEEIKDPIYSDDYNWPFKENSAYSGDLLVTASSYDPSSSMKLKVDNEEITPEKKATYNAKIRFEYQEGKVASSESVEHCYDEITFNDEVLGVIPADDSKGINVDFDLLQEGDNVFTVTTGQVYVYNKKYNPELVHGFDAIGNGDDFAIGKVRLEFIDGQVIYPYKMVLYKPKAWNTAGYVTQTVEPDNEAYYMIGDGWGKTEKSLTYVNHPDPYYDRPYKIAYYFESYTPDRLKTYNVKTSTLGEGKHTLSLYDGNEVVLRNNVYFDNVAPNVSINVKDNDFVNNDYRVKCKLSDITTGVDNSTIKLDGTVMEKDEFYLSMLTPGKHNIAITATDRAGNLTNQIINFGIRDGVDSIKLDYNNGKLSTDFADNYNVDIYESNILDISVSDTKYDNSNIPSQDIDVKVADASKPCYIEYSARTTGNEIVNIDALNVNTGKYENITSTTSEVKFIIKDNKYINSNNQIKLKATVQYVGNGSNRLLWSSDTQYLPKVEFTDINYMYPALMNYVKDQYLSGEISYYVHTGDIVDDNPSYGDAAVKEWENATDAFEILDAANVQYGVNAGNHDVGSVISSINYDYYKSYFGNKRFANMDCYGGNLNDNEAHYDLITIGGIDFIFMYIGFGIEPRLETINYVKKILSMYKHRNAIICTHAYLSSDGTLDTDASGQILYDNYVVPNENVKMVFCGHTDGNVVNKKPVSEGRYVYEILNCYQFVQTNQYSVSHKISGLDCNGEGFLRDMVFDGNHVSWTTYSPVIGTTNPLGANDSRSIDVDFIREKRILETLNVSACQISGNSLFSYSSNDIKDINLSNDKNYLAIASASHDAYGFERL